MVHQIGRPGNCGTFAGTWWYRPCISGSHFYRRGYDVFARIRSFAIGALAGVLIASPVAAQLPIPRPAVVAGVSSYRLGGATGDATTPIAALRVDLPLVLFLAEGSLGVF